MTGPSDTGDLGLELAELLLLVHDWLSADQRARISFDEFMPTNTYTTNNLRSDLLRFAVLLGADVQ